MRHHILRKIGLLLLPALLLSLEASCQTSWEANSTNERWTRYTTENGLPSNQVDDVRETPDGAVWVTSAAGLAWYNGFVWHSMDSSNGIPAGAVVSFYCKNNDSICLVINENLYVGTTTGFHIALKNINHSVRFDDSTGVIFSNSNLSLLQGGILHPFAQYPQTLMGSCSAIWSGSDSSIWTNCTKGIFRWNKFRWEAEYPLTGSDFRIRNLVENQHGSGIASIQLPINMRGLWEWDHHGKPIINKTEDWDVGYSLDIADNGDAIAIHRPNRIRIRHDGIWYPFTAPSYLKNISSCRFRHNGDIWLCGENGLYLCERNPHRWTFVNFKEGDARNKINEILFTKNGDRWLGTGKGIEILDHNGNDRTIDQISKTTLYDVTGLAEDGKGNIWISSGSGFDGSYRWDGKSWSHFAITDDPAGVTIHKIYSDLNGDLWFLGIPKSNSRMGEKGPGAFRFHDGIFENWGYAIDPFLTRVYSFAQGKDSAFWFGTINGILRWKSGEMNQHFLSTQNNIGIFTLTIDSNNIVWFGIRNNGLGYLDEHYQSHYFSVKDGLVNNSVWEVKSGSRNELWISTRKGLALYDHGIWSQFDENEGLTVQELWPIALHDNKVYVGSNGGGLAILDLTNILPPPKIELGNIVTENSKTFIRWHPMAFWEELPSSEIQTRFRIDNNDWSAWSKIHEITLQHISPGLHTFKAQAKGLFGKFDDSGVQASFTVSPPFYLQPGFFLPVGGSMIALSLLTFRYFQRKRIHDKALRLSEAKFRRLTEATFEGVLLHDNGIITDANQSLLKDFGYEHDELIGKHLADLIAPESRAEFQEHLFNEYAIPFETNGIRKNGESLTIEVIGRSIPSDKKKISVAAIRDITDRKHAEQKLLEYQEKLRLLAADLSFTEERERRRMATYLHDDIGQTLALCRIKLGMLKSVLPHNGHEDEWNELKDILERSIQDTRKLTFELSPPILHELSIIEALEWLAEQVMNQYKITVQLKGERDIPLLKEDHRTILFRGVRELLINACKHSEAKHLFVVLQQHEKSYEVCVEDDGIGFSMATVEGKKVRGFGLFNLRERLDQAGGNLQLISRPGRGTRAIITIPLDHYDQNNK